MFDEPTKAFYRELFKFFSDHAFGVTTNGISSDGKKWTHAKKFAAADIDAALALITQAVKDKREAHYHVGLFSSEIVEENGTFSLPKRSPTVSRCFVLDLDVHHNPDKTLKASDYASGEEATQSFNDAVENGFPTPDYVVSSGSGGLHLYYFVSNFIESASHSQVLKAIHGEADNYGLKYDKQAGFCKGNLRLPGTINRKPHIMQPATVVQYREGVRSIRALQKAFNIDVRIQAAGAREVAEDLREEFEPYEVYTSDDVKASCKFMIHQLVTGSKDLDRTEWLGVASVVRHLQNWNDAWSDACKKHYGDVTDAQLASALDPDDGLAGPISCEAMGGGVGHPACDGCQIHTLKRGSGYPINWIKHHADLRRATPVSEQAQTTDHATEEPDSSEELTEAPETEAIPDEYLYDSGFVITAGQSLWTTQSKRGKVAPDKFICRPAFKVLSKETGTDLARLVIEVNRQEQHLLMQNCNDKRPLATALGRFGIMIDNQTQALEYVQTAAAHVPESRMVKSSGWSEHFYQYYGFEETMHKDGHKQFTRIEHPPMEGKIIGSEGNWAAWRDALQPVIDNHSWEFTLAIAMGFASVLVPIVGASNLPAVVSFYHPESGMGKTTCLKLANSVFMKPYDTNIGFSDTDNSVFRQVGILHHHLATCDELTSKIDHHQFDPVGFINQFMQGTEKARLNTQAGMQERVTWENMLMVSSNSSFGSRIAETANPQGATARLHEVYFGRLPLRKDVADEMAQGLDENHGVAGPYFVKCLLDDPNMVKNVRAEFKRQQENFNVSTGGANEHRFAVNLFALSVAALRLTNSFGITAFTTDSFYDWCVGQLSSRTDIVKRLRQRSEITPAEFYRAIRYEIYTHTGVRMFEAENKLMNVIDNPVFYKDGCLFFTHSAFKEWVKSKRYPISALGNWQHSTAVDPEVTELNFKVEDTPLGNAAYYRMNLKTFMQESELHDIEQRSLELMEDA